ncbi:hypothetical protein LV779_15865 [Streptomyces thinghirensis]|nr:hypothetical protein [Streptomyces thinghirensis]
MLATVLHLHRGTPFVYQGEELGMANALFTSIDDLRDIESSTTTASRPRAEPIPAPSCRAAATAAGTTPRTPMQWDATDHAGFTTGVPWIAVNPGSRGRQRQGQSRRPESVFHYRRLIAPVPHRDRLLAHGTSTCSIPDHEQLLRRHPPRCADRAPNCFVLANFSGSTHRRPVSTVGNTARPHRQRPRDRTARGPADPAAVGSLASTAAAPARHHRPCRNDALPRKLP